MSRPAALQVALALAEMPALVHSQRRQTLPADMTLLLQIASGDPDAVRRACVLTHRSAASVKDAAGFFIEQILFDKDADSYRVLGATPDATAGDLRRHMALLVKWLHPDTARANGRSLYATRVTEAWETVKTKERRAAYDRTRRLEAAKPVPPIKKIARPVKPAKRKRRFFATGPRKPSSSSLSPGRHRRRARRLSLVRLQRDTLFARLLTLFKGAWR